MPRLAYLFSLRLSLLEPLHGHYTPVRVNAAHGCSVNTTCTVRNRKVKTSTLWVRRTTWLRMYNLKDFQILLTVASLYFDGEACSENAGVHSLLSLSLRSYSDRQTRSPCRLFSLHVPPTSWLQLFKQPALCPLRMRSLGHFTPSRFVLDSAHQNSTRLLFCFGVFCERTTERKHGTSWREGT